MTDYNRCLEAADWRLERLEAKIDAATALNRTHALVAERNRLGAFATYCQLAAEFDRRGAT